MVNLELSLSDNQETCHVNNDVMEKTAGLILEYILNNEKLLAESVLGGYDLSDKTVAVDIVLTDDEEIHELNKSYRDKDKPTDVLSFALFADSEEKEIFPNGEIALGEVIISVETAKMQADEAEMPLIEQLDFLLCHGVLHLLGFDHPDEQSLEIMLEIQNEILTGIKK